MKPYRTKLDPYRKTKDKVENQVHKDFQEMGLEEMDSRER